MNISSEINNYTEVLLSGKVLELELSDKYTVSQLADLCCLVLNQVKPLYHRFDIDLISNLSDQDRDDLDKALIKAIQGAELIINQDRRANPTDRD